EVFQLEDRLMPSWGWLARTTTSLAADVSSAVYGQSISLAATVTSRTGATPSGTVTFMDNGAPIDTEILNGGEAVFSTSALTVGTHSITADYSGDTDFRPSTSAILAETVSQDGSTTVLESSLNPSSVGQSIVFTATVTAAAPGSGMPTGTVTFMNGTTALG